MDQPRTLDDAIDEFEYNLRRTLRPSRARWMDADERRDEWEREQEEQFMKERQERPND